mmetsp:Transcript_2620/g.6007  ORF Transcript_2620/g.6007 Transcript_2620/m.6007 type:complete len:178 (-) Transcript_2620:431-964(-)
MRQLARNIVAAGSLGCFGDAVCQKVESLGKKPADAKPFDFKRNFALGFFNASYVGVVCEYVYRVYPPMTARLFPGLRSNRLALRVAIMATMLDNFVHVPLGYIPAFYLITEPIQGSDRSETVKSLREHWWRSTYMCWSFWIPFQGINFYAIAKHNRVVAVAFGNLLWTVVLDYIAHR